MTLGLNHELQGAELWRRQCARNLMDCYAVGMSALTGAWARGGREQKAIETLTRLMVEGMTVVKTEEDERVFYRMAAASCRECAEACGGEQAGLFRIYGAIFEDMTGQGAVSQEGSRLARPVEPGQARRGSDEEGLI